MWISPSIPGSISTNAPKLVRLRTLPVMRVTNRVALRQDDPRILLGLLHAERDFLFVGIALSTTGLIASPMDTSFDGCRTLRVQLISPDVHQDLRCPAPARERPVVVIDTTLPWTRVPTGYFAASPFHG